MSDAPQNPNVDEANPEQAVDLRQAQASYANFCRVSYTPDELILDFALSTDMVTGNSQNLVALQRVTLGHYTGKRLLEALQMAVDRHEAVFGVVETAIERRVLAALPKTS